MILANWLKTATEMCLKEVVTWTAFNFDTLSSFIVSVLSRPIYQCLNYTSALDTTVKPYRLCPKSLDVILKLKYILVVDMTLLL